MIKNLESLFESRFWALALKEIRQIFRNKQLLFLLLFPPTIQLIIFGFALSPDVHNLRLGIVDQSHTEVSRELISAFTRNNIFQVQATPKSTFALGEAVRRGDITAGLVIPPEFKRDLERGQPAQLQILIDGVDANTAGIAAGYTFQIVNQFSFSQLATPFTPPVSTQVAYLYNPGLKSSWFFVPGVLGVVVTLGCVLVSSATVVREKDTGTLEQLLMTPSAAWEILIAKLVPLFFLLMGEVLVALTIGRVVFQVPFRGNFGLYLFLAGLYICVGIGLGTLLATLARNQRQVVLTSFFINLPLIQLSGSIAPIESMPTFFQILSLANPLRHFIAINRGVMLKGVGLEVLWPNALALAISAILLLAISANQFRKQLS
jgi:ABC-2 type transport system permease protein